MKNLLTKKNIFYIAIIGTILYFLFIFSQEINLCSESQRSCIQMYDSTAEIFQIFIPMLLISLAVYKIHGEVYTTWLYFARWWVPLSMFLVLIAPYGKGDWMFPHDKGRVSLLMSGLFLFISLTLIVYKSFKLKKT